MFFQVEFSGYHQDICNVCGSIPGAKQVGDRWSRRWHIPIDRIQQLEAELKEVSATAVLNIVVPLMQDTVLSPGTPEVSLDRLSGALCSATGPCS